ncbi:uncharacterized protein PG986_002882 [Apiospora aurea]|uniref:Uncharacterized protein n=1 Tax=Apiospora aurea TaxID=335848 RepID=A0ABR1QQ32_9PEZI
MNFTSFLLVALTPVSVVSAPRAEPIRSTAGNADPVTKPPTGGAAAVDREVDDAQRATGRARRATTSAPGTSASTRGRPRGRRCSTAGPLPARRAKAAGPSPSGPGTTTRAALQSSRSPRGLVIYPGYTDQQIAAGHVVKPDQSYYTIPVPS